MQVCMVTAAEAGRADSRHAPPQARLGVDGLASRCRSEWRVGEPRHVASEVSRGSWERTCQPQERTSCLRFPLPAAGAQAPI